MLKIRKQAGDTLIEVLFAVTVFSLIVVTALSIMNQGSSTAQRALEISLVRQQIDNQVEVLRFLHESYVANYQPGYSTNAGITTLTGPTGQFYRLVHRIATTDADAASDFGSLANCPIPPPNGSFVLNTRTATVVVAPAIFKNPTTYAQLDFDSVNQTTLVNSSGIWIEAVRSDDSPDPAQANAGYIDFHIRACWEAPGLSSPTTLGTIVRLYEPRG